MHYRLTTLPATAPSTVADELRRFIANTGHFSLHTVVVQPPYAQRHLQVWVIEVPDGVAAWVEDRLFPIILGPTCPVTRSGPVAARAEWTQHALLLPTPTAQALDPLLLRPWTSASLQMRWTPGRCGALLHFSPEDAPRLDEIRALGWRVVPLQPWLRRVVLKPVVTRRSPLLPLLSSALPAPAQGFPAAPPAAQEQVTDASDLTAPVATPLPSALAGPGEPGLLLGVTPQDVGVRLAWRALACAIEAPVPRQRAAFVALLHRAFAQGMGVVAIVPRGLLGDDALRPWADWLRVLDGARNPIESAAIPWQTLPPHALAAVLARLDITTPLPDPLPAEFGALLRQLDAGDLCTQAVLIQTARPGDDLPAVVAQGGGVVLVDTDDAGSDLLGSLLLELVAHHRMGDRPLLLMRPARLPVPPALADRCLQIVLGPSTAAVATLAAQPGHWLLRDAQGAVILDDDLTRTPSEIAAGDHAALVTTLRGADDDTRLPLTLPGAGVPIAPPAHHPGEPTSVPALRSVAPPEEASAAADAVPAVDPPAGEPGWPGPGEDAALDDWSAMLADTITGLDSVATALPSLPPRSVLLAAADLSPAPNVPDTFDWWTVTADLAAPVAGPDGGVVAPAPDQPPQAAAAPAPANPDAIPESMLAGDAPGDGRPLPSEDAPLPASAAGIAGEPGPALLDDLSESTANGVSLPTLTLASLDDWDVAIGAGDLGVGADEAPDEPLGTSPADTGGMAADQDDRDLAVPVVTPFPPRAPAASLWLRPPRRRWTPRVPTTLRVAALASGALDHPALVAAAPVEVPSEPVVADDGVFRDGAMPAAQALTPAQPVGEDAAQAVPVVAALDPTADARAHPPAQDESWSLPLALPSAAPTAGEAEPEAAATQDSGGAAQAHDDRSPTVDGQTDGITAPDVGVSLSSPLLPREAAGTPAQALPDPSPPAAPAWPDLDRAALIAAWRSGLPISALITQLQADFPDVASGDLRTAVRAVIQAALHAPATTTPLPDARARAGGIPASPSAADPAQALALPPAAAEPARDQPSDPGLSTSLGSGSVQAAQDLPPAPLGTLDPTATDDQIWAAWLAGMDLTQLISAISGQTPRSTAGQAARERIHQLVVPRLVVELGVQSLVARWLAGAPLSDAEREPYERLLQRMNRQPHPVTGTIRLKTEQRLRAVMASRLPAAVEEG